MYLYTGLTTQSTGSSFPPKNRCLKQFASLYTYKIDDVSRYSSSVLKKNILESSEYEYFVRSTPEWSTPE
jgi:hypothetical protein